MRRHETETDRGSRTRNDCCCMRQRHYGSTHQRLGNVLGQTSDGTSIVVDSVSLPAAGFIAVHANADGSPGAVIGHSDLLPAGTSTDVVVTLDQALTATDMVFPMAHLDVDDDGEYTFAPPDNAVDTPATTEDGSVAVVGAEVTVGS